MQAQTPAWVRKSSFGNDEELASDLPPLSLLKGFQQHVKPVLTEYFVALVVDDAVCRLQELLRDWSSAADEIGVMAVRAALDRDEAAQRSVVQLLCGLHDASVLDGAALIRTFEKLFCTWEDIAIDTPRAPEAILAVLHGCFTGGLVDRSLLTKLPESLLNAGLAVAGPAFSGVLNCITAELRDFKQQVGSILEEYFVAFDADEVGRFLRDLDRQAYHHEFVKKAITLSFVQGGEEEAARDATLALLTKLTSDSILSKDDLQWGMTRLLGQLDDLELDCPRCVELTIAFVCCVVAGELVSVPFLRWCRLLRIGGATGLRVLDDVHRRTPEYSKRHLGTAQFKGEIQTMIKEYFDSSDEAEVARCVRELAPLSPERSSELVRKLLVLAMERTSSERDLALRLLTFLVRDGELDIDAIERGFDEMYTRMAEILLDVPNAEDLAQSFVAEAKENRLLGLDWPYPGVPTV